MGLLSNLFSSNNQKEPKITVSISGGIDEDNPKRAKRKFSDDDAGLIDSINSTEDVRPSHKLALTDVCPYCGVIQPKPIGRKKKCSDCKKTIFVRTTQDLFPTSALTEEQVAHADFYMALKNTLMATKDDYDKHEVALKKKWNTTKVNTYDVLWSMYNDMNLLQRNIDKSSDKKWATIELLRNHQITTFEAAEYQAARGNDPVPYLKTAQGYSLQSAKLQDYVKGLTVQSYSCCDACTKFHDKTFSLDFIEKTPVLPIKTCTRPFRDDSKFVYCTCRYSEYTEWE